ncbi:MAG: ABC transporter ATP-binding protein, partial [Bacilli bacterium]
RNYIFTMIQKLKSEGATIIYSSHYLEEVEALCDRIVLIEDGMVLAEGAMHEIVSRYRKPFVYVEGEQAEQLAGKEALPQGAGWIILSDTPLDTIADIAARAKAEQCNITRLEIHQPTLEEIFLSLTGKALRDGGDHA